MADWIRSILDEVALSEAGDPGPVVIRRLSNWEYTYSIRDLTGIESLDPVRDFPVDGAAGEGFTNAGAALVMSPSLLTSTLRPPSKWLRMQCASRWHSIFSKYLIARLDRRGPREDSLTLSKIRSRS